MSNPAPEPAPEPEPDPENVPYDQGDDTREHDTLAEAVVDKVAERLEGGPPPRDDPPDGERADPHSPPLDRLEDLVHLDRGDPRRVDAERVLAEREQAERPEGEHYAPDPEAG